MEDWASTCGRPSVANDGTVCAVAFSSNKFTDQWLGSRVISAQRQTPQTIFSLGTDAKMPSVSVAARGLALSTAKLFSAVQPSGTLYGLQHSIRSILKSRIMERVFVRDRARSSNRATCRRG